MSVLCLLLHSSLTQSLAMARERIQALEMQLNQLLSEKNTRIHELESSVHRLEQELHQLRSQTRGGGGGGEGRRRWHSEEDLLDGGGVAGGGAELQTLQETVDSLTEQLTAALEELEELQNQYVGIIGLIDYNLSLFIRVCLVHVDDGGECSTFTGTFSI